MGGKVDLGIDRTTHLLHIAHNLHSVCTVYAFSHSKCGQLEAFFCRSSLIAQTAGWMMFVEPTIISKVRTLYFLQSEH